MRSDGPYLFLQGPSSLLFAKIADNLGNAGQQCYRINLNVGDQIFWRRKGAVNYRGTSRNWGTFIRQFINEHAIRTLILLGEERPYHKEAVKAAKESGVTVVAIEMGYLRPDWVTVELDGLSSNSHFPRDPEGILKAAEGLPTPDLSRKYSQTFFAEALFDLSYYLPASLLWFLFPYYRFHGIYHPLAEYAGWIVRLATKRRREKEVANVLKFLQKTERNWFIFPLQLETDYQLRAHSRFSGQKQVIETVISSFAENADCSQALLVKVHPLDNGLISWRRIIDGLRVRYNLSDRLIFTDGGKLEELLRFCVGMVTVNSSAALPAITQHISTKVLGEAIYNVPKITDQGALNEFWQAPHKPDPEVVSAFVRLLAASIQVRGNFYSANGVESSAGAIADRLLLGRVNLPQRETTT